jgi:hypothetical protein
VGIKNPRVCCLDNKEAGAVYFTHKKTPIHC